MSDQYLILKVAAYLTGYTTRHLAYLLRRGSLEGHKIEGFFWVVSERSLKDYLKGQQSGGDGRCGPRRPQQLTYIEEE